MLVRRAWPSLRLVSIAPSLVLCWISVHTVEGFDVVRFPVAGFHPFLAGIVGLGFGRIEGRSGSGGDGRGHAADSTEKVAAVHRRLLLVMHRSSSLKRRLLGLTSAALSLMRSGGSLWRNLPSRCRRRSAPAPRRPCRTRRNSPFPDRRRSGPPRARYARRRIRLRRRLRSRAGRRRRRP